MKKTFFNHDSSARNDYRIIKLRANLGYEGYGIFWAVLELLFTEENKICTNQYDILAYGIQCDADKLKRVIEDFDLFVIEDGCFYSSRLNNQIDEINSKSKKAKESAAKRWSNAAAIQPHSNGNASKVNNSKAKETKPKQSKSISERSTTFKQHIDKIQDIDSEDKENFYLYWSEPNKSETKMRWELEKTWNLTLRLKRWARHNFSSNNTKKTKFPDYHDSFFEKKLDADTIKEYHAHLKSLGFTSKYTPTAGMVWNKKR
jgi:hypothetical protein